MPEGFRARKGRAPKRTPRRGKNWRASLPLR